MFVASAVAIYNYNSPVYMNFNGGKGTVSVIEVIVALDWKLELLLVISFSLATIVWHWRMCTLSGLFRNRFLPCCGPLLAAAANLHQQYRSLAKILFE